MKGNGGPPSLTALLMMRVVIGHVHNLSFKHFASAALPSEAGCQLRDGLQKPGYEKKKKTRTCRWTG